MATAINSSFKNCIRVKEGFRIEKRKSGGGLVGTGCKFSGGGISGTGNFKMSFTGGGKGGKCPFAIRNCKLFQYFIPTGNCVICGKGGGISTGSGGTLFFNGLNLFMGMHRDWIAREDKGTAGGTSTAKANNLT